MNEKYRVILVKESGKDIDIKEFDVLSDAANYYNNIIYKLEKKDIDCEWCNVKLVGCDGRLLDYTGYNSRCSNSVIKFI